MILDLTRLVEGRLEASFRLAPGSPVFEGLDGEILETFELDATLRHPSAGTYMLDARLSGALTRPCRRCLAPVELDVDDPFRIFYQISDGDEDAGDDDIVLLEAAATGIDLTEVVRARLFLGTEPYPVCREECAGFCPQCGQDLNTGTCSCEPVVNESPWAEALQVVRDRVQEPS
ncbi:MAG: YceD family protein [Gemmatimonadota bacterium]